MESNNKEKFQKNGNIKDFNSRTIYAILYFLIHDRILYILWIYKISDLNRKLDYCPDLLKLIVY